MHFNIEYERGSSRRDPEILGRLLHSVWRDWAEGGDGSSVSPAFPAHLSTLQAAAQELVSIPALHQGYTDFPCGKLKPEWLNLITLIFHCYFQYMRIDATQEASLDPLIDSLLLLCDCKDSHMALLEAPGYVGMMGSLGLCIIGRDGLPPDAGDKTASIFTEVISVWNHEKYVRLRFAVESVMPWSVESIEEGSLSPPTPAAEQACINPGLLLHTYQSDNVLTFPDMVWLGASHDGHPRYSSITSYVSARWSPSFTVYDNAALWQAAMTFGVLEAITDLNIPEALLLEKRPDGVVVFTCRNIGVLVYHWIICTLYNKNEARRKHSLETLCRAQRALSIECGMGYHAVFNNLPQLHETDVGNIICAVYLLLTAFHQSAVLSDMDNIIRFRDLPRTSRESVVDIFVQKMIADGWCPSFRHSDILVSPQYWWYASSFKPFIRNHQDEHVTCSQDSCATHSIDEATYKTLHVTPECSCPFLSPSFDSLRKILRSGRIPVIAYTGRALAIDAASSQLPYVAISHVWVDGLGSSTEKGLPRCQIERIHRCVLELLGYSGIPFFWIDGLCIPEDRELRNKAITMMRQTYEDAAKVLVLDSSIRTLCSSFNPVEENVFRIGASMWMKRVWTLQEALLAKELFFEFSTGITSAASLHMAISERENMYHEAVWHTTALILSASTPTHYVLMPDPKLSFAEIAMLLFHRSTSKAKDEPLAIAGLLNVDTKKILSQPDLESRIRTLFVEVGTLPRELLFGKYERMKTPGFRWCPSNLTSIGLLGPLTPSALLNSPEAVCTFDGLTTKTKTLVLCFPRIDIVEDMDPHVFVNVTSIGAYYSLKILLEDLLEHRPCSINALIMQFGELSSVIFGTGIPAVAVNIPGVQGPQDVQITKPSTLVCEYVMNTTLLGCGETWDPVMEGKRMLEGRPVQAKVMVT